MSGNSWPNSTFRILFRLAAILYRCRCGWLLGRRFLLLLINEGRRTRKKHYTVLEVIEYRSALQEAIVLSGFGPRSHWLLNIQTQRPIEVVIGSRRFGAVYRILGEEEAVAAIMRYQHHHRLIAPLIRSVLGRLVGWHYDGSPAYTRRPVKQLPVIGFRPALCVEANLKSNITSNLARVLGRPLANGPDPDNRTSLRRTERDYSPWAARSWRPTDRQALRFCRLGGKNPPGTRQRVW